MLRWRKPHPYMDLAETLYYVYEAKRFGEISPFVGKDCTILIASGNETFFNVQQLLVSDYPYLASQFQQFGPQTFAPTEPFPHINFYAG